MYFQRQVKAKIFLLVFQSLLSSSFPSSSPSSSSSCPSSSPPSSFSSLLLLLLDLIYIFERKRETSTSWRGTEVEVDSPLSRDPDTWGSIPGHQDHDMSQKLQLTDWPIQELLLTIILFSSSLLNTLKFLNIPRIWVEANLTLSFMVSLHVSKHIVT